MVDLEDVVDAFATQTGFSGVVRVDRDHQLLCAGAYGLAHRGWSISNRVDTRFGIASGTKAITALTVLSLIEEGRLELSTTARSLLGPDLPLVDGAVTVEHLLSHTSGIGDYFDEEAVESLTDYVMSVPVHRLVTTEDYLAVLDGHPHVFAPGERFAYNNGAYVVLALLAERVGGAPFPELVRTRVCEPAGMHDTAFLRSDEPDGRTASGYLEQEGLRTNVLHLPVRGSGDGGLCTTAADVSSMWRALYDGTIVPPDRVAEMVRPRHDVPGSAARYGMGFWLHPTGTAVILDGADAGVSFRSVDDRASGVTYTVLSNMTGGAEQMARRLGEVLAG